MAENTSLPTTDAGWQALYEQYVTFVHDMNADRRQRVDAIDQIRLAPFQVRFGGAPGQHDAQVMSLDAFKTWLPGLESDRQAKFIKNYTDGYAAVIGENDAQAEEVARRALRGGSRNVAGRG